MYGSRSPPHTCAANAPASSRRPPASSSRGKGELDLAVEPPVGALMRVRRLPVGVRVVLCPRGHVAVLHMLAFLAVRGIAPLALDVRMLGAGGLPTGAGTETDLEVIDRHAVTSVVVRTHAVSRQRNGNSAPSLLFWLFWPCIVNAVFG